MGIYLSALAELADNESETARLEQKRRELLRGRAALVEGLEELDPVPADVKSFNEPLHIITIRLDRLEHEHTNALAEIRRLQLARANDWRALEQDERRHRWAFGLDLEPLITEIGRLDPYRRDVPADVGLALDRLRLWARQMNDMEARIERERAALVADGGEPAVLTEMSMAWPLFGGQHEEHGTATAGRRRREIK